MSPYTLTRKANREKAQLSSYENYTHKSGNYDKTREPIGTEILVGCFAHAPVPLNQTAVLDAGCGTGSYSEALLGHVGRIHQQPIMTAPQANGRTGDSTQPPVAYLPAHLSDGQIAGDPGQPGVEPGDGHAPAQRLVGSDERRLGHVLGRVPVPQPAGGQPHQPAEVLVIECLHVHGCARRRWP